MKNDIRILSTKEIKGSNVELEHGNIFSYPIHAHLYYEILIYDAFDGEISVNGARYPTSTPTAILLTPSDFHSVTIRCGGTTEDDAPKGNAPTYYKWKISLDLMGRFSDRNFCSIVTQEIDKLSFLLSLCRQGYKNRDDRNYLSAIAALVALSIAKDAPETVSKGKSTALIKKATDIINQSFREPITLTSVADKLHVSPQHLSTLFSRYAGISFATYLSERRLYYAKALLENGYNSTEACFDSGYRNLSHFIRSFKKRFGITPSQYAKKK